MPSKYIYYYIFIARVAPLHHCTSTARLHLIGTQNLVQTGGPFFSLNFGTQLFKPLAVHTLYIELCTGGLFS